MILWKNGICHTLENETATHEKIITDKGKIIGFDDDANHLPIDQEIDLCGGHLYPGFVDSHLHLLGYGRKLTRPNLSDVKHKSQLFDFILKHPHDVVFEGYEGKGISFDMLSTLNRPIILRHRDYHSATVNQKVLDILKLTSHQGKLSEDDAYLAMAHFGQTSDEALENMFLRALKQLHAFGVTGGHSDDLSYFSNGYQGTLQVMDRVVKSLPFRAHLLVHHAVLDEYLKEKRPFLDQHEYLQLGAIKIFYDGTFSSKTALVSQPYHDGSFGIRIFEPKTLEKLIIKIRRHGLPLAIHVIGDQALHEVLLLLKKYPVKKGLHDRLIHASLWQKKSYVLAKELSLIFDVQPQFLYADIPAIFPVFKQNPQSLYPFKTMMNEGLTICGGSDAPVEVPHPLIGMYDAIFRETKDLQVYQQSQRLTRFEALKLYTVNSNIPTYHKNRGYLKKGYIADFTVLKEDVNTVSKAKFKSNTVLMTVVNEQIVYTDKCICLE